MTGHEMDEEAMNPHKEKASRGQFNFKNLTETCIFVQVQMKDKTPNTGI